VTRHWSGDPQAREALETVLDAARTTPARLRHALQLEAVCGHCNQTALRIYRTEAGPVVVTWTADFWSSRGGPDRYAVEHRALATASFLASASSATIGTQCKCRSREVDRAWLRERHACGQAGTRRAKRVLLPPPEPVTD